VRRDVAVQVSATPRFRIGEREATVKDDPDRVVKMLRQLLG